jgi:hypothetical protein
MNIITRTGYTSISVNPRGGTLQTCKQTNGSDSVMSNIIQHDPTYPS